MGLILLLLFWTYMLNTVHNFPCADLQNSDARSTSAEDVLLIFADLKRINGHRERLQGAEIQFHKSKPVHSF